MEEWKQIEKIPVDYYFISNKGRLKTIDHVDCLGRHKCGHIVKQSTDRYGYKRLVFHLVVNGKEMFLNKQIHRLVAEAFIPNPKKYKQVNHIDGDKCNNCVGNLEWCTAKQNTLHALKKRLRKTGEQTKQARFSNDEVRLIKSLLDNGTSQAQVARIYDCPYSTIKNIAKKRCWNYLSENPKN